MSKISVLMPIYNTNETYLREAISSILEQTYKDFEFIILSDSPDNTRLDEIVASFDDTRIKYVKNEKNIGITPSRNKLIYMAQGQYLAVMDHDDISLQNRFLKQVEFLDNNPDYGVVGCGVKVLNSSRIADNPTSDENIKLELTRICAIVHPSSMIRKSVLLDNNIKYEEEFSPAEDYALWCKLSSHTKFANLSDVLFYYRDHESNTSKTQSDKMYFATQKIHSFMKVSNPYLYDLFLRKARHKKTIKLLNFLPLLSVVTRGSVSTIKLFDILPILQIKNSVKIKSKN